MENLSKNRIIVNNLFKGLGNNFYTDFSGLFGKEPSKITEISSYHNCAYYNIYFESGERIVCGRDSITEIRKVEKGIFAGSVCVIEVEGFIGGRTQITVVHDKEVFKYPALGKCPTPEELDYKFETSAIQDIIAESMNTFVLKKVQPYEFLCEGLPKKVWQDEGFVRGIKKRLDSLGDVKVDGDIDKRFINLDECKRASMEYLDSLTAKQTKEKELAK